MLPPATCPRCNRPVQPGMNSCPYCGQVFRTEGVVQPQFDPSAQPPATPQQPPAYYPPVYGQGYQYPAQPPYQQATAYDEAAVPQQAAYSRPSGLLFALVAVSVLAVIEAAVIIALLIAGGQQGTAGTTPVQANTNPAVVQQGGSNPSTGSDLPRGVVGQRVESAGLAITVVQVVNEPDPGVASVLDLSAEQKYIAAEVILENNSGNSIFFTSATFKLRDAKNFEYSKYPLAYRQPELDFGTMSNREKIRGYINFVVPRDVTGLSLIYQNGGVGGYSTIYISLGQ